MSLFKSKYAKPSDNESASPANSPFIGVQAKLNIGKSNDKYEQEADRVADKVVNKSQSDAIQQKEGDAGGDQNAAVQRQEEEIQQKPIANEVTPFVQKKDATDEEQPVQKKDSVEEEPIQKMEEEEPIQKMEEEEPVQKMEEEEAVQKMGEEEPIQKMEEEESVQKMGEEEPVQAKKFKQSTTQAKSSNSFESRLNSKKGSGNQMDASTKSRMESGFGTTFNNVKIHNDSEAASMSSEINAQAFAHGKDVFFNKGKYKPGTNEGDMLLAHELTHTIQQSGTETEAKGNDQSMENDAEKANVGLARRLLTGVKGLGKEVLPRLKSGLRVSKCAEEKKKSQLDIIKEGPSNVDNRTLYTNYSPVHLKQQLARINVLVEVKTTSIKKKNPMDGKTTNVYPLILHNTTFTNPSIIAKINKLFPAGKEAFMIRSTHSATKSKLNGIVGGHAKANPSNFSEMQASNLLNSGKDVNACIGTMNKGIRDLYGNKTIDKGEMSDTAFGTIKKLNKKNMAEKALRLPAIYSGKNFPIEYTKPAELAKVKMASASAAIQKQLAPLPNGPYVYAFSIANGYHSVTLIVHKQGSVFEYMWKDQGGIQKFTASELDNKILRYVGASSHNDFKRRYNKDYGTKYEKSEEIPKGDKYDKAGAIAIHTTKKNIKENLFGLLKPAQ